MRNWDTRDETPGSPCPSETDYKDAKEVCTMLGIPIQYVDLSKEYWTLVFEDFVRGLEVGETPNPDVACNRHIKFDALVKRVLGKVTGGEGMEWIATGHYARVEYDGQGGATLLKAADPNKDQTYYLSQVSSESLSKAIFPVGGMMKSEVKALAAKLGFPTAMKKESMGICFIGKRSFGDFIGTGSDYVEMKEGPIVSIDGKTIGTHNGLARYTLGQGARVSGESTRMFVYRKDLRSNTLIVVPGRDHPSLFSQSVTVRDVFWINGSPIGLSEGMHLHAKYRHGTPAVAAVIKQSKKGSCIVEFLEPQWGITPGQMNNDDDAPPPPPQDGHPAIQPTHATIAITLAPAAHREDIHPSVHDDDEEEEEEEDLEDRSSVRRLNDAVDGKRDGFGRRCGGVLADFFSVKWVALWVIAGVTVLLGALIWGFHDRIIPPLMEFCARIREMGFSGALIMGSIVFATCFPPMIGYGTSLVMCGFIFGFPYGFVPAYMGAVAGGVLCFLGARRFLGTHYRGYLLDKYPKLKVVEDAIEQGGLKLIILIRLAPYPFGIMNVIFSTTSISLPRYATATAIAAFKNLIHIYVGSTLQSLADIGGGSKRNPDGSPAITSPVEIAVMVGGLVAAIGGFIYLTHLLRRAIRNAGLDDRDEENVLLSEGGGLASPERGESEEVEEVVRERLEMHERNLRGTLVG
ncbi:hypothetical protein HDU67_004758 [Dinochytrium kinnereticum]|nr:hypothetical protein HDU67_004758 [Dinochytrium kinnereticum]